MPQLTLSANSGHLSRSLNSPHTGHQARLVELLGPDLGAAAVISRTGPNAIRRFPGGEPSRSGSGRFLPGFRPSGGPSLHARAEQLGVTTRGRACGLAARECSQVPDGERFLRSALRVSLGAEALSPSKRSHNGQ